MATNQTLCIWSAAANEPPTTGFATPDLRNGHLVLDFDAGATETAIFRGIMPANYSGLGVDVRVIWMASTATSANAVLETAFERCNTDLDADSFATAVQATGTANGTSGITTTTTIAHTNGAQMDSVAVGEMFRLRVQRIGGNGSDTMTGDLELVAVELQET